MLPRLKSNVYNQLNHSIDYADSSNLRPLEQTRDYLNRSLDLNDASVFKQSQTTKNKPKYTKWAVGFGSGGPRSPEPMNDDKQRSGTFFVQNVFIDEPGKSPSQLTSEQRASSYMSLISA